MTREETDSARDLGSLVVPAAGALVETGDLWEPYYLGGPGGGRVVPVSEFLRDLQATGRPATTQRSYALALLRWFRFTWAVNVPWDQATRIEARDFCRYLQLAGKPGGQPAAAKTVPGKRPSSGRFAPSTVAHCETVCRGFYGYHLEAGTGPIVNPFPLARPGRAHAHHNPIEAFPKQKAGLFRPKVPQRVPKQIPDAAFNELFARLGSHRDRALVAFWVSAGARASELLSVTRSGADPGQQLITVIRKGSRAIQQLPASPDAFVWLRLYQQEVHGLVPAGPDDPLWWTLRRPFRPLTYDTARKMFDRANDAAGTGWTLHSLRHTAAYRLARDPDMPITDVQWVLGHALLSTTQVYVYPQEAISGHRAFIARPRATRPSEEYRSPTDTEWEEFLGHFEHRKLALGDCGRAYATSCIHEHSCIRCPMLRTDPAQRHRLEEIRDNLQARINEAEREGWSGEAEGLRVSLDAANNKIAQADLSAARRAEHVNLGLPTYRDIATTLTTPGDRHGH